MKRFSLFLLVLCVLCSIVFANNYTVTTFKRPENFVNPFFKQKETEINSAINNTTEAAQNAVNTAQNAAANTVQGVQNAANNAQNAVQNTVNNVQASAQNAVNNAQNAAQNAAANTVQGVQNAANNAQNAVQNTVNNVQASAQNAVNNAQNAAQNAVNNVSQVVEQEGSNAINTAENAVSSASEALSVQADTTQTPVSTGRLRANSSGRFKLGATVGYTIHNGNYERGDYTGEGSSFMEEKKDIKLESNFLSLALNMSYKLKSPIEIYANIRIGWPDSLTINGKTHNSKNHWNGTESTSYSDFKRSRNFSSFSLGAAYVFNVDDFVILAGGGLNFNNLNRTEQHVFKEGATSGTDVSQKMTYHFSGFGVNLHLEGRYQLNEYCVVSALISPSFSFSANYKQEYFEKGESKESTDNTISKINTDIYAAVGLMYSF